MYEFDVFLTTHNHIEQTIPCIDALYKNTADFKFRLTVLDDSTDRLTPVYLEDKAKEKGNIQYLNPGRPFVAPEEMYNLALSKTDCAYVVVMTNSARVERGWIGSALQIMSKGETVGAVGFKTLKWPSGIIENAGVLLFDNEVRNIGLDEAAHLYSFVYKVDAVGASACLFRREAIKEGFDFSYYLPFGGYEDIDYCLRMKERGWEVMYCGYGAVYHDGAATRGRDPAFWDKFNENKRRFVLRWKHLLDRDSSVIKGMQ